MSEGDIGSRYPSDEDKGAKNIVDFVQHITRKLDEVDPDQVDRKIASAISTKQDTIADLSAIREGAAAGATAVQDADLASVAKSGSYADLTDKPDSPSDAEVTSRINAAVKKAKDDILDGVADEYDTLKELAAAIGDNKDLIDGLGEIANGHVAVDKAQSFTDAQKSQARSNIGAVSATDFATSSKAGLVKPNSTHGVYVNPNDGVITGSTVSADVYESRPTTFIVSKGTLENIKESLVKSVGDDAYAAKRTSASLVPYGTVIGANADLNSVEFLSVGNYYCTLDDTAKKLKNCPAQHAFMMRVYSPISLSDVGKEETDRYVYRVRELITHRGRIYRQAVNSSSVAGSFSYALWTKVVIDSDLSNVATSGSYNDLTNKPTIPTVDSSLSSASTNPVQNRVVKASLDTRIATDDIVHDFNSFAGRRFYSSFLHNVLYAADKRYTVTETGTATMSGLVELFNGNYDTRRSIPKGSVWTVTIETDKFNFDWGYPYGWIVVSFYYVNRPKSLSQVKLRLYQELEGHNVGWVELKNATAQSFASYSNGVVSFQNSGTYGIKKIEITIDNTDGIDGQGEAGSDDIRVTQIEYFCSRTGMHSMPVLSKHGGDTIYGTLTTTGAITAPSFNGKATQATQDASGNVITDTYLRKSDAKFIAITEDMCTVVKNATKGVAPYNASYGTTDITVDLPKALLKDGLVIIPVIVSSLVIASSYRNVRIRFGEDDAWHPVFGSTTILAGSTYWTATIYRCYVYRTNPRSEGAFHLLTDSNTTYSTYSLGIGYGTCSTAEATVAKAVTLASYALVKGGIVSVSFDNNVCANATMDINAKGAKPVYYRGAPITDGVVLAGDVATFIYDGTNYVFVTSDRASQKGETGDVGPRGYTFTPSVSADGVLSWTNNGGLENPAPVDIRGPKGDKGDKGDPADPVSDFGEWEES